jgi:two-component system nitrate/nitrite response regulator NarL
VISEHALRTLTVALVGEDPLALSALAPHLGRAPQLVHRLTAAPSRVMPPDVDVVVWDLGLEARVALDQHRALLSERPTVVLVPDEALTLALLAAGARAVVDRGTRGAALIRAIEAVAEGLVVLEQEAAEALVGAPVVDAVVPALTTREREVLTLVAEGLGNRAVAARLGVSEHTIKFHVSALCAKLAASTRTELVVRAARAGLLML